MVFAVLGVSLSAVCFNFC